jgi:nucleotide-binding universal stress UspA family protein
MRAVDDISIASDEIETRRSVDLATREIADLAARIGAEHPDLEVRTEVVRGEPGDLLTDRSGAGVLVVVGAENGHTEEYWFSSRIGARISGAAAGPVAVIPVGDDRVRSGVLVGVDHGPEAGQLCRFAAELASARGEPLHALHVESRSRDGAAQQAVLDRALAAVTQEFPGLAVEGHVESGTPAGALLQRARDMAVVVVGSRRLGTVRRMFLGSVSHTLVTNARCPTIVVPPDARAHG